MNDTRPESVIRARGLEKRYGSTIALRGIDLDVPSGRIVGLIGRNGAGKTTALKSMLGLTPFGGELEVLGLDPFRSRRDLMERISYIADVAVLPRWMRVEQVLDFAQACHPKFSRAQAEASLRQTDIKPRSKVKALSKGMVTQLHLALVMAIDARLLILDEPTLGLDVVYRKLFYSTLLNDYFDHSRTIVVTTHQVEEIEHILTDVIFIERGEIVLAASLDSISQRYFEVAVPGEKTAAAKALGPIAERRDVGQLVYMYETDAPEQLRIIGEPTRPTLADLFVARVAGGVQ
ncbi:MAG: ABC transporter ATP-binding protein [Gammaproteobacteria bacterium]|jgi:ABC-2 type transport system ATP-binding protein